MSKILVTGASGYVGAKLYKDLVDKGLNVVGTYLNNKLFDELVKCDITNEEDLAAILESQSPDIIIHVAAVASNSEAEANPVFTHDLNVNATKYLVEWAKKNKASLIYISTFGAISPKGVYGKTKAEGEKLVKSLDAYTILRPSLIIGMSPNLENDRPFSRYIKNISNKDKNVEYDLSWEFHPTFLSHLSQVCQYLIDNKLFINKIIPVVTDELVSRYQIGKDILDKFDIKVEAVDEGKAIDEPPIEWNIYDELGLPKISYEEGINEIISDIKNEQDKKE